MFIAEAPGRNGADRTRIPFHGDTSGRNFESLLASIELTRDEIFITNAVLCSPRKPSGANDKPARSEIRNCSDFLRRQIELINPPVVATLGAVADRKSTRLNSSHVRISYAVFCLKKKKKKIMHTVTARKTKSN